MATSEPLAAHTAASRPAGPAASGPNSAIGAHDPLSRCLEEFVALTGRPASAAALVAGLPLENGLLSPESLRRALENHGYATLLTRVPLKSVKSYQLPAIVLMAEGDACIWLSRRDRDISIRDPLTGSDVVGKIHDLENGYDGACLFARRSGAHDYLPDQGVDRGKGHWFWSVIRKLWPTYGYVFLAAALINILALASPIFMMNVYDRVLPNKAIPTLWVLAAGFALALLFDYLLKSLRGYLIDGAGRRADVLLASHIYSHVLGIQMSAKPATTGSFASHLKEFENVREFFTSSTIVTIADMAFFGLFLLVIWNIGGVVAVVPAAAALMLLVFGLMFQIPLHRAANRHAAETAQRHSLLVESIAALETVKAIRAESHLQRIWEGLVGMTSQTVEVVRRLNSSLANLAGFIQQFVSLGVIVVGAYLFEKGEISMGGVIACVMLAGRAVAPLSQFAMVLARSQQSFASLSTLNKIMQMPSERPPGKAFISRPVSDTGIQFQNVDFSYPGSQQPVLAGVSIIIRPGEKVGIIGKIGSGKTTLGRLLTKLYEPSKGAILMGGVDIRQYHPHEIRRVVGLLGQDGELFHGTIRSNVLMANPRAADDELIRVCRLAGVEDFVRRNPAGYDMQVGERGSALSGGQRQSVALARLLIGQPKVIFLDEPSSAMDLASERVMIEQLKNAAQPDQTVIVATHRYSMLDLVERLIVINNGKIAADGPRDQVLELLKKQAGAPRS